MQRLAFWLGTGLLLAGAAAAVAEVLTLVASGGASRVSLGGVWYALSANSLVGFQAAVERHLGELAGNVLVALLALPAWLVLGLLGLALRLLGRGGRRGFG
jgi:anti-sigma factor RsiW